MTVAEQDGWCDAICALFPGTRPLDRRKEPSHGYRAVHIIPKIDGRFVEIQLRTLWQDTWAQLFESLADTYGRQIRYGLPPDEPGKVLLDGTATRQDLVDSLVELAPKIELMEKAELMIVDQQLARAQTDELEKQIETVREMMKGMRNILGLSDPPEAL